MSPSRVRGLGALSVGRAGPLLLGIAVFAFVPTAGAQVEVYSVEVVASPEAASLIAEGLAVASPEDLATPPSVVVTEGEAIVGECLTEAEAWATGERLRERGVEGQAVSREVESSEFGGLNIAPEAAVFAPEAIAMIHPDAYARLNHHTLEHADQERAAALMQMDSRPLPPPAQRFGSRVARLVAESASPQGTSFRGLGRILTEVGADALSPPQITAMRQVDPAHLDDRDLWAVCASYRMRADRAGALAAWDALADRAGNSPEGLYARARLAGWIASDGRSEEARQMWEDLVENHPHTPGAGFAQYRLAYLDSATGHDDEAVRRWREVAEGVHPATDEQRLDAMMRVAAVLHRDEDLAGSYIAYRQLQQVSDRRDIEAAAALEILGLTMEMAMHQGVGTFDDVLAEYNRLQSLGPLEPYVACRADLMRHEARFFLGDYETALENIAEFRSRHSSEEFRVEFLAAEKFEGMTLLRMRRLDEADAVFARIDEQYTQEDAMPGTDPRALALLYRARICLDREPPDVAGAQVFLDRFEAEHADSMHAQLAAEIRAGVEQLGGAPIPVPGGPGFTVPVGGASPEM